MWDEQDGLRWRILAPFGVEIDGDLAAPLAPAAAGRLCALFAGHGLILARRQRLDRARHDALLALLGPIIAHREGEAGFITSHGDAGGAGSELAFHADAAYTETPFAALSLHALDVVDGASSTRFVDAAAALDRLAPEWQALLARHEAEMLPGALDDLGAWLCEDPRHRRAPAVRRLPAIRRHPASGRACLAVSAMHTAGLAGLDDGASHEALAAVFATLYAPAHIHEHVWHDGDLLIWDNLRLQHARGSLVGKGRRILQRVIVGTHAHATPHIRAA